MEDDDLEYDITFPAPKPLDDDEDDDIDLLQDFVVTGETKEPVVILIGWAGCKDKYLAKYSKIYEQKRCITIRYIPPKEITFFKPELVHGVSLKLLDLIGDYCLEDNPIFFHIFSNNGSFVYAEVSKILRSGDGQKYCKFHVCGTIIDSAPGKRRVLKAAQAYALSTAGSTISMFTHFVGMVAYLIFLRIYFFFTTWLFKKSLPSSSVSPFTIFEAIKEEKSTWPQLFLCSKGDKVIPYTDVEEIVAYRRDTLKLSVDFECWENGEHVSLLRENPESYANRCSLFISDCLRRENDEACGGVM